MSLFTVVQIEHGYDTTEHERRIVAAAGGRFIDADKLPLAEALKLCETAEGILVRRLEVTAGMIRRFARCKIIVRYGVGTDNVDVAAATEAKIIVGHVPAYGVDEVSTHAIALLLTCVRRVVPTQRKLAAGGWNVHGGEPIWRMRGKTLGLVGLGHIGQDVARKLNGWGLHLLATDPFVEPDRAASVGARLVQLDTLCRESDFISLHCPLLPETRHLINPRTLGLMKPGCILINTARGPVVDTAALCAALEAGRLGQAGLDVFEEEPLPVDSPLRTHPHIVCSDHTAWYSEESQQELQQTAAAEAVRVCTGGLPLSLANPEVLRHFGGTAGWIPSDTVKWQCKRQQAMGIPSTL